MVSLLIAVVITAIIFDFINGFHDAANAIATSVSTGVLSIRGAVILAGLFNFLGAMAGTAVAGFIAKGLADAAVVSQLVVLSALIGAIVWNLITWWYGIPSSSSHALVGGVMGAVVAHAGVGAFKWEGLQQKVLIPLVVSPLVGFLVALILMIILLWIVRGMRPGLVNRGSRKLQLVSACMMGFSHGSNDAQKSMGIITLALTAYALDAEKLGLSPLPGWSTAVTFQWMDHAKESLAASGWWISWLSNMLPSHDSTVPFWVVVACALAIAFGTMGGGKRIIKTMGSKIIRIVPIQGFAAETSGTLTILTASHMGIPISTTHVINACILGVGASKRVSAVRWNVALNIVMAWILTLPMSGLVAYVCMIVLDWFAKPG
jgi:inorganic phosphate transporter, PiT family